MRPVNVSVSSQAASAAIPVNWRQESLEISIAVVLTDTPTLTYSVQVTLDDVQDSSITPTWFDHDVLAAQTANKIGNIDKPVRAIRLNVTAWTAGTATLTVVQSGP
jgi:hypothetical protein